MLAAGTKSVAAPIAEPPDTAAGRLWKQIVGPVEPFLDAVASRLAEQVRAFDPGVQAYADYALNGQGKQLRPALVALTAEALGTPGEAHVTSATIIEMVHLATLVHDDIMDEAELRRGRLTLAANWGNEIAVLFGDCLFARALELAASFPTPEVCRAVAAATNTVCAGELLQTQHRRNFPVSQREYFKVLEMKTAELFALSCDLSAFASGATAAQRAALRAYGMAFGTAYQLYDDCLDLFGVESQAKKSLGTDLAKGKLTLPVLQLWKKAQPADRQRLEHLVQQWEPGALAEVVTLLNLYGTIEPSLAVVHQYLAQAGACLHGWPDTPGRAGLLGVTEFLARQTDLLAARFR
jgi:octaprenyl-diphosphate synthase